MHIDYMLYLWVSHCPLEEYLIINVGSVYIIFSET